MTDYIYALLCPQGEIRYIGKSTDPTARLRSHISRARSRQTKHHAANWIRSLLADGKKPAVEVLLQVPEGEPWEPYEIRLIAEFKAEGHRLTNSTGGGEGFFDVSPEAIAKRVAAHKITRMQPEYRARMSAIMTEVRNRPEFREEMSHRLMATWQNEISRKNMLEGMRSPEGVKNRSQATVKRYEDPEQRSLHAERSRKAFEDNPELLEKFQASCQTPEAKAKRRESLAEVRKTPEYKAKNLAALAEIKERPEVKAKKAAAARANYEGGGLHQCVQSEEFKANQAERLKGRWKDPAAKAKMHEARWTDEHRAAQAAALEARREKMAAAMTPEVRAKQGAKMKEYWARKRAEKATMLAAATSAPYTEPS
jgi:hypothetical protein